MARLFRHHSELTDGVGRCSVPAWSGGCPAGFCDEDAYGKHEGRTPSYDGYVPALACYRHGGPKENQAKKETSETVHVVFDGPPGPVAGRFVELETPEGVGLSRGKWVDRGDGMWALELELAVAPAVEAARREGAEAMREAAAEQASDFIFNEEAVAAIRALPLPAGRSEDDAEG